MEKPKLEALRFDTPDVITTSGELRLRLNGFEDSAQANGIYEFIQGSKSVSYTSYDDNLLDAFTSFYGGTWNSLKHISILRMLPEGGFSGNIYALSEADKTGSPRRFTDGTYKYMQNAEYFFSNTN